MSTVSLDPGPRVHEIPGGGRALAARLGYPPAWLDAVPQEALDAFAGVGHMIDLAGIELREIVLDLGCGAGTDTFVAAALAGREGRAIGVGMSDALLGRARGARNAAGLNHISFCDGLIEEPPVEPGSVDVVISNGAATTERALRAAAAALRPGGRFAAAALLSATESAEPWAVPYDRFFGAIRHAGLHVCTVRTNPAYRLLAGAAEEHHASSVSILAVKH